MAQTRLNGQLLPEYCNFRLTREIAPGKMVVETDFHHSIKEAVEDAVFANLGVINVHKVEWKGRHIGPEWNDVTDFYKNLFHEGTVYGNA